MNTVSTLSATADASATYNIRFSDGIFPVPAELFADYPHCPINQMIETLGYVPPTAVIDFSHLSSQSFAVIQDVMTNQRPEWDLPPALLIDANLYGLLSETTAAKVAASVQRLTDRLRQPDAIRRGQVDFEVLSPKRYQELVTTARAPNVFYCRVIFNSSTELTTDDNDIRTERHWVFHRVLLNEQVLFDPNDDQKDWPEGYYDINTFTHYAVFGPETDEFDPATVPPPMAPAATATTAAAAASNPTLPTARSQFTDQPLKYLPALFSDCPRSVCQAISMLGDLIYAEQRPGARHTSSLFRQGLEAGITNLGPRPYYGALPLARISELLDDHQLELTADLVTRLSTSDALLHTHFPANDHVDYCNYYVVHCVLTV
jgi:hypothetical protein